MLKFNKLSLRLKILLPIALSSLIGGTIMYYYFIDTYRESQIEGLLNKVRTITIAAEGAREYSSAQSKHNIFKDSIKKKEDLLYTVPIFSAMEVLKSRADVLGFKAKVPKISPRNPDNEPDEIERQILTDFQTNKKEDYWFIDEKTNTVRYFRAIKLSQECLKCHGDPAKSHEYWGRNDGKDITGTKMEGWKEGEIHGAFEVIADKTPVDELIAKKAQTFAMFFLILIVFLIGMAFLTSNSIVKTIKNIIANITQLTANITNGKLDVRAKNENVQSEFIPMIDATNNLIDSFVAPLNLSSEYIDRISKGDIPEKITENYYGDFNEIKNNINALIDNINNIVLSMNTMSEEHTKGEIDYFINSNNFTGTFNQMVLGINQMVNDHIKVKKQAMSIISEYSKGNFDAKLDRLPGKKAFINETLDLVQKNLKNVNQTIANLSLNAKNGNLTERADISKFEGDWARMVNEVNNLIDQLLAPINEAVSVLQEMSDGNFNTSMTGDYKGDHSILKHAINQTIAQMPFKEAVAILQKLSEGDFRSQMTGDYKGDSLMLKNSLNSTIESITDILNQVAQTVDEVTRGSMQVADASTSLSQGATEQAASLEEITSSMSEIGSQTNTNAHNASTASNLTFQSKNSAERGNQEMGDLNKAMSEITQSSRDISKIIKVIDEIAFQTNLLALNAAVEAARAGRHGKGFAVVAEEVRNLAARSASAAKETAEMIEGSIRIVEKGSSLAIKTSEALEEIRTGAIRAADLVGEIAKSSNDQANAISQISEGLHQIDKVTQTNTASAEESASASEELSGQASNLKRMIMKFKLPQQNQYYQNNNDSFALTSNNYNQKSAKKVLAPKSNYNQNPEDFINLDNDDFGRY
jgi:methyl-accepting chemotaxis protein